MTGRKHQISIAFQTDKSAARYIELARFVDQYDFDGVSVYCDLPYLNGYSALLLMSPHLRRARVGVAAVPPTRMHPVDIAANAALLAEIARGGTYIGLARGAWLGDVGLHEHDKPLQAMREAADAVRYLLTGGQGGYAGEVFPIAPHVRAPYPLPAIVPPLLIGSWGRKMLTGAGEVADEVKLGGSANSDLIPTVQSWLHEGETRAARTPGTVGIVMGAVCVVDEDRAAAREMARRAVALYLPVVAPLDPTVHVESELIERIAAFVNTGQPEAAAHLVSDDLLDRFALAGDVHDLVEQSARLFAAGARRVEFGTPHGLAHPETGIRLIGEQVIPRLRTLFPG